jgi:protein-S-isoprenylcysteine O-methyltransferase Ste14
MDVLLFALQVVFMLPMLFRVMTREAPDTTVVSELAATLRTPGLFLHMAGLLLVWIGSGIRLFAGATIRSVTPRGIIGNAIVLASTILMFWAFSAFRSWRLLPVIEGRHELCTAGPYRLVRHPIYLAFDLLGIGVAICAPSPVVILGALCLLAGSEIRSRREERALVEAFGDRYRQYQRQARRVIPGIY